MATSIPANASSPASIRPVGPPPAISTECSVTRAFNTLIPLTSPVTKTRSMRHDLGLAASPRSIYTLKVARGTVQNRTGFFCLRFYPRAQILNVLAEDFGERYGQRETKENNCELG